MVARVDHTDGQSRNQWNLIDTKQNWLNRQLLIWAENNIGVDGIRWIGAQHGANSRTFIWVQEGKSYSGNKNDSWGMNFSAMELYALIHDLEQQRMAIRRGDW